MPYFFGKSLVNFRPSCSIKRTRVRILLRGVKPLGNCFHSTLLPFTQLYKRIPGNRQLTDTCASSLRALFEAYGCMLPRDGVWLNRTAREVKCKALWAIPRIGYCAMKELTFTSINWTLTLNSPDSLGFTQNPALRVLIRPLHQPAPPRGIPTHLSVPIVISLGIVA